MSGYERENDHSNEAEDRAAYIRDLERREADFTVEAYLNRLCAQVKAKELHPELREEMRGHIDELIAEKEEEGSPPNEAALWAIRQMGDADEVGGTLGKVHRPKFNWRLLIPIVIMAGIGLLALFSLSAAGEGISRFVNVGEQQLVSYGIGIAALIACFFFDYRLLKKYAIFLYATTVLLTVIFFTFASVQMNGTLGWVSIGPLTLHWTTCMFILFILALPGLFERLSLTTAQRRTLRQFAALGVLLLPVALYMYFDLLAWLMLALYLIASVTLYARAGGAKLYLYALPAAAAASAAGLYIRNEHWQYRIRAVFDPQSQNLSTNYMNDSMTAAIREGGWFGQGFGASSRSITYAYSDTIFPYLTHSFGWIVAGILIFCIGWVLSLLLQTIRSIQDEHGRSLAIGLSVLLAGQWIYGIGASLSLLPFTTTQLPFIGYGGTSTLIHCAIIGIILGIYRRKDMLPRQSGSSVPNVNPAGNGPESLRS